MRHDHAEEEKFQEDRRNWVSAIDLETLRQVFERHIERYIRHYNVRGRRAELLRKVARFPLR